ncbi:hypothetical protein ABIE65_003583 [Constrictibacter sp. MBR-5]|jgi:hypothetical protein|uniref:hypothetical protein n=1 Tax=Constrictibacter sp. MBR-5 TaxID=3156467 RepID=UPI003399DD3B
MPTIIGSNHTLEGREISDFKVGDRFPDRQSAVNFITDFIEKTYEEHGYDGENCYWWGRQKESEYVYRFRIT